MRRIFPGLLVVAPLAAHPQVLQSPLTFDCDVPPGHFSKWEGRIVGSAFSVSGTVEFLEAREDERWAPVASILLSGDSDQSGVGLQFGIYRSDKTRVQAMVRDPNDKEGRTKLALFDWKDSPLKFAIDLAEDGRITMSVGGANAKFSVPDFKPTVFHLSCSTADVLFKDVSILGSSDT